MESIFKQIFEICVEIEKLHKQEQDKIFYKLFGYKRNKRNYKDLYKTVNQIETINDIQVFESIVSDYIDSISVLNSGTGHCKNIETIKSNRKAATFEYIFNNSYKAAVICINDKDKTIICNFHIFEKGKDLIGFDVPFTQIKTELVDNSEEKISELAEKAQLTFISILKDDICRYLNGFISDSEGRITIHGKEKRNYNTNSSKRT